MYVIDGYIVSDNLQVDQVQVIDTDFEYIGSSAGVFTGRLFNKFLSVGVETNKNNSNEILQSSFCLELFFILFHLHDGAACFLAQEVVGK